MAMLSWLFKKSPEAAEATCTVNFADGRAPVAVARNGFLLASALEAGVPWPHNCKVGTCGQCKARVVGGRIRPAMDFALSPLTAEELGQGYVLACQSRVREDILVDVALPAAAPAVVRREAVIRSAVELSPGVMQLRLELDAPLVFMAGQYVDLGLRGFDAVRSYSLCESPQPGGVREVSFLIRRLPGGVFSERLFSQAVTGQRMHLRGPYGTPSSVPQIGDVVGVAGGTGLAPMLSLMGERLARGAAGSFTLFLGLRSQEDTFAQQVLTPFLARFGARVRVQTWLSEEPAGSAWDGPRGLVTQALRDDLVAKLKPEAAYLCGAAGLVHGARDRLVALGLPVDRIHADAFSPSGGDTAQVAA